MLTNIGIIQFFIEPGSLTYPECERLADVLSGYAADIMKGATSKPVGSPLVLTIERGDWV